MLLLCSTDRILFVVSLDSSQLHDLHTNVSDRCGTVRFSLIFSLFSLYSSISLDMNFSTSINYKLNFLLCVCAMPGDVLPACKTKNSRSTKVRWNILQGILMAHSLYLSVNIEIHSYMYVWICVVCVWTNVLASVSVVGWSISNAAYKYCSRKYLRRVQEFMAFRNELNSTLHISFGNDKIVYALCHELFGEKKNFYGFQKYSYVLVHIQRIHRIEFIRYAYNMLFHEYRCLGQWNRPRWRHESNGFVCFSS